MTQHICPDCKNVFLQPFRCTTCGAQKLYDTTLRQAEQRAERAESDLAVARALLKEMRDASFIAWQLSREGRDYLARIDAALAGKKK